jgi:pimeloyl-ACP methyl ester carboxylesterase
VPPLFMIIVTLCLAAASCGGHPAPAASTPPVNSLTVKTCMVAGLPARCGTLIVPEDRLTRTGRTIPIRFVVIPATGPDRAPDPVVWFSGGPGGSAVEEIPGEMSVLAGLNIHRDLVFVEQRGTGTSNPLNCPAFSGSLADKPVMRASIKSCLAGLPGDLRFYTTAMYADDVNELLGDLHYAKANLIGISYGTDAEQVFALRHPARVRTMTLISGSPLNIRLFDFQPGNSQLALDYVFAQCESQPACHQAFPHLAADWAALWASVGKSPWFLPAAQSPTRTTVRLGGLVDGIARHPLQDIGATLRANIDQEAVRVLVHHLGERQIVTGVRAWSGAHGRAEAGLARLGAVHRDDEQPGAARRVPRPRLR